MGKVLITGGTGLIGGRLTELLLKQGHEVNLLDRNPKKTQRKGVSSFAWNYEKKEIDPQAFTGVSAIVHLAGANIAEKRWTDERKKEVINSRVKSAALIEDYLKNNKHSVKTFVSASAVGYYGDRGEDILTEEEKPGHDFLATVCKKWEAAAIKIGETGLREVRCRFGIVLAKKGGALPELTKTTGIGIASYFAKDNLYYPWVHIDDVCGILTHAITNKDIAGPYNTTAPQPLLMKELMQHILKAKHSKALLLPTPPIAIKLALGQMSEMILCSQRCDAGKIIDSGYEFVYGDIDKALKQIYG